MKKIGISLLCVLLLWLTGCFSSNTPKTNEQMREEALTCFAEHKQDMITIIENGSVCGRTDWCEGYDLLPEDRYEFDLYCWGFTGTNIQAGLRYLPDDHPGEEYLKDDQNENIYVYQASETDRYYAERIEACWYYFYDEYDF